MQEFSLDEDIHNFAVRELVHIPGASNTVADALSRLSAPEPKSFPSELCGARRALVPARGASFYLTLRPARARARGPLHA